MSTKTPTKRPRKRKPAWKLYTKGRTLRILELTRMGIDELGILAACGIVPHADKPGETLADYCRMVREIQRENQDFIRRGQFADVHFSQLSNPVRCPTCYAKVSLVPCVVCTNRRRRGEEVEQ